MSWDAGSLSFAPMHGFHLGGFHPNLRQAAATLLVLAHGLTIAMADAPRQTLRKLAEGFVSPLNLVPFEGNRLLVADQIGLVHVMEADGKIRPEPFLDLRPRLTRLNDGFDERGLLGLTLHPRFKENRLLYAYYSAPLQKSCPTNWDHTSHVSEFTVAPDLSRVDLAGERLLLQIDQPFFNHNCGRLAFGPDGYLYIGMGDGGAAHDQGFDRSPTGNAQDLTTLLGKILRIDVAGSAKDPSSLIPKDNPFVGRSPARPEIFAFGLRNPWGMSFDRGGNHELFAADVGQGRYEEVNIVHKGGNYGWNQREGLHPFDPKNPHKVGAEGPMDLADRSAVVDPIIEYRNLNTFPREGEIGGISVTGGYVYRGKALPHLEGRYVFADWSRQWAVADGRLFVATRPSEASRLWPVESLPVASHPELKLGLYVLAFGEDDAGELYVLTSQRAGTVGRTGAVWKLVPNGPPAGGVAQ